MLKEIKKTNLILSNILKVLSEIANETNEESSYIFNLQESTDIVQIESSAELVSKEVNRIKDIGKREGVSGIRSGFDDIDKITLGWQDSDLIIIAGRPGMGVRAFVLSMVRNIAVDYKLPIAFFTLELSSAQLITKLISLETSVSYGRIREGKLTHKERTQFYEKAKIIEKAPIFIADTPALSIDDFKDNCRRLVNQNNVKIIVVDFLQLMTVSGNVCANRKKEESIIYRSLKATAKELSIPIIALSQLPKSVEKRKGSKRPFLSDIRNYGTTDQVADIVSFVYRPEYYNLDLWDNEFAKPCFGQAEFIIAKNRNGALDNVRLRFLQEQAKFTNLE